MMDIREAEKSDLETLYALYKLCGKQDDGYFERCMEEDCTILIASLDGQDVALSILNWNPRYALYRRLGIPEIQDLNVIPDARRNGVATSLIKWCEGVARARGKSTMGIGVGLTRDYGPAQILYVQMGYVPDGNGVTHDRVGVVTHASYRMDDDLSLMMTKEL